MGPLMLTPCVGLTYGIMWWFLLPFMYVETGFMSGLSEAPLPFGGHGIFLRAVFGMLRTGGGYERARGNARWWYSLSFKRCSWHGHSLLIYCWYPTTCTRLLWPGVVKVMLKGCAVVHETCMVCCVLSSTLKWSRKLKSGPRAQKVQMKENKGLKSRGWWLMVVVIVLKVAECRQPVLHRIGGGKNAWAPHVNFTQWSSKERFYVGDWLCKYRSYH